MSSDGGWQPPGDSGQPGQPGQVGQPSSDRPAPGPRYGDAPRYGYHQESAGSAASAASASERQGYPSGGYGQYPNSPQSQQPPFPPPGSYPQQPYQQQPYQQQPYQQPYEQQGAPQPSYASQQPYGAPPSNAWTQPWVPPNLSGWGRRVGAYLIDRAPGIVGLLIFYVGYFQWVIALTYSTTSNQSTALSTGVTPMIIGFVVMLAALGWDIYNRWITGGRTGQSLGKRVLKISLVSEQTGQPIGALNAFLRDLVHVLDGMLYIGFLWPLWDDRKQTFADKIMKTYVVDTDKPGVTPGS